MGSLVNLSLFDQLQSPINFRSFSIKFVASGCERYTVNGRRYNMNGGQYLLANQFAEGNVFIDSNEITRGICIDVAPKIISEAVACHLRPDTIDLDEGLDAFFTDKDYFDNKYKSDNTKLGQALQQIDKELTADNNPMFCFNTEFYFHLAECVVADSIPTFKALQNVKVAKRSTRNLLFRKLLLGKEFIDANLYNDQSVVDAAISCGLSEYHFFRLFRQAFGQSPRQYIISKRLSAAHDMLLRSSCGIGEVAEYVGYADIHAFGKAYRKQFGHSPKIARIF